MTKIPADTEEEDVEECLVTAMDECSSVRSASNDSLVLVVLVFVVDLNTVLLALFSVLLVVSIDVEAEKNMVRFYFGFNCQFGEE